MFNPDQFLDLTITSANDTVSVPIPVGEYLAVVRDVKVATWAKKDDPSVSGLKLNLTWDIDSPELKELLGRKEVKIIQGVMLDITDDGQLDMGKGRNISLGRLREATDLNKAGNPFSFNMLTGRMAKIKIKHRIHEQSVLADVEAVAHA
jgi:hypothetical protein